MVSAQADFQQTLHFSSDRLPENERIAVWREVYGQAVLRLDIEPLPDRPFQADICLRALPGLGVVSGAIHGVRDRRTRALIGDGNDDIGLAMHWGGVAIAEQGGREATLHDGDAVFLSCGAVAAVTRPGPCRYLGLRVPRAVLASVVPNIEDIVAVRIPHGSPGLVLLQSYVSSLLSDIELSASPALHRLAVSHIHDLLAFTLVVASSDRTSIADSSGVRAARLRMIKNDIVKHLCSRDLAIGAVAARQGLTPRYIQRLFEHEGSSFTSFVLGERLALAHRVLSSWPQAGHAISAVAFEVGFGDLSYFNRVFRRHYGVTPSSVREAARKARN